MTLFIQSVTHGKIIQIFSLVTETYNRPGSDGVVVASTNVSCTLWSYPSQHHLTECTDLTQNGVQSSIHCLAFQNSIFGKSNKPFTDFEGLIGLQQANSTDGGRVLHSKTVVVVIIGPVSSQMKKNF